MSSRHYARPLPPTMLSDGTPQRTHLRASRAVQVDTEETITHPPRPVARRNSLFRRSARHLLGRWYLLGCGGLLVLSLYLAYMKVWVPVWTFTSQHWQYGEAQIVQLDADVGHGGISHFLAQWYHGSILLIEISEANPHEMHAYKLDPFTQNEGLIRLVVFDVNRDDKPDILIQIDGDPAALVLYNTGTGFTESREGEG